MTRRLSARGAKSTADRLFSALVRRRAGHCEACGSTSSLQCAHIWSRRYVRIRWDPDNAVCLCARCHLRYTDRPIDFAAWVQTVRTAEQLERLRHAVIAGPRPDLADVIAQLRLELEQLEELEQVDAHDAHDGTAAS